MKISWILALLGSTLVGCTPPAKDAGEVVDTETGSEGESGASIETSGGGSVSSTTVATSTTESTTIDTYASEGTDESAGSTTGDVPMACIDQGWDVSYATFMSFSDSANGTYYYTRYSGGSGFKEQDCVYETTIEAAQGSIVRRSFAIIEPVPGETVEDCDEQPWVEEADAIGTHDVGLAATPYTMDELYAGCCDLLALEPAAEYTFVFSVDDAGVVAECYGYFADCVDGCDIGVGDFYGFRLEEFAFAN